MHEKRNNRPKKRRKRTPEEIKAIKRRKARARWEEALRDSNNDDERGVKYRTSREDIDQYRKKRTYSEKTRNSQRVRNEERPKRRYPEDFRSSRFIKGSRYYQEKKRKRSKIPHIPINIFFFKEILDLFLFFSW